MDSNAKIPELIDSLLFKPKRVIEGSLIVWEHKTLNIHRGILHWRVASTIKNIELAKKVRNHIHERFKVSWWRGFAFGTILDIAAVDDDSKLIINDIDIKNNSKGTWQWAIIVCHDQKVAFGVHTWMVGMFTPIYQSVLEAYRSCGYEVGDFKKEKDGMMRFLTKMSRLKGISFTEFEPKE